MNDRPYPYWPFPERPALRWPDNARLAFWLIPNIEFFRYESPVSEPTAGSSIPDVPNLAKRDYGPRIGVWRLMALLDKHNIRATAALNAEVCAHYPQIVEAGAERGWEWMGHGLTNSIRLNALSPDEEEQAIKATSEAIRAATGQMPLGWLGPGLIETSSTLALLAQSGYTYVADWCADDQPFSIAAGERRLISVPYSQDLNDIPEFMVHGRTPESFFHMVRDQFDVLYDEGRESGRVMALALHPYLSGHPYRSKWLDRALTYITRHSGVWLTTGGEIAAWYDTHYRSHEPQHDSGD